MSWRASCLPCTHICASSGTFPLARMHCLWPHPASPRRTAAQLPKSTLLVGAQKFCFASWFSFHIPALLLFHRSIMLSIVNKYLPFRTVVRRDAFEHWRCLVSLLLVIDRTDVSNSNAQCTMNKRHSGLRTRVPGIWWTSRELSNKKRFMYSDHC